MVIKPKILFILHVPPPVHGSSMVGEYIKKSKDINETFNCSYINLGTSRSIDEIGNFGIKKLFKYISILWKVGNQLLTFKPDLCYVAIATKGIAFYKDSLVVLFIKIFGVKIVYHLHNKGVSDRQTKLFDNLLYKLVFSNSYFILLSKYLYPDIKKYVQKERVQYCPNGIPESNVNFTKLNYKNQIVEILFLSNLIKSKGVYILLEALKILKSKKLNFHCTFVGGIGDINEKTFDLKVKQLDLKSHVNYVGKKYGKEKDKAFIKADIFAFPTFYDFEAFPLVNLEAMQFSLPVISTFEGGIPDAVINGETGFLVHQNDVTSFEFKLEILIQNPELRSKMGEAGRKKYKKNFTLKIFEENLIRILSRILENKS